MRVSSRMLVPCAVAVIVMGVGHAQAQWSTNGNKVYYSSGKVGIGTPNPNSPLQVVSAIGADDRPTLLVKTINTNPEPDNTTIRAIHRSTTNSGVGIWGSHDGTGIGMYGLAHGAGIGVLGECGDGLGVGVFGSAGSGGVAGYFDGRGYFDGNVGLGVAIPSFRLQLATDSAAKPTSNTWTISSDRRLKKNIKPIHGALHNLMLLRGVTYQWKNPETQGDMTGTYTGMIAQDVEKVFPEWVREDANGYKTLTVTGFEGIVVEALRELRDEKDAEIDALRAEKDAEIDSLTARVAELEQLVHMLVERKGAER